MAAVATRTVVSVRTDECLTRRVSAKAYAQAPESPTPEQVSTSDASVTCSCKLTCIRHAVTLANIRVHLLEIYHWYVTCAG